MKTQTKQIIKGREHKFFANFSLKNFILKQQGSLAKNASLPFGRRKTGYTLIVSRISICSCTIS